MSDLLDRAAAEAARHDDPDVREVVPLKLPEPASAETTPADGYLDSEAAIEGSANLADVLAPGEHIQSDRRLETDSVIEYVVQPLPGGGGLAVPTEDRPAVPVAVDRAPTDDDFQTASVAIPDNADEQAAMRDEVAEAHQAAKVAKTAAELREAKWQLHLARTAAKAEDLGRRLR